jgi:hypothetical protein
MIERTSGEAVLGFTDLMLYVVKKLIKPLR